MTRLDGIVVIFVIALVFAVIGLTLQWDWLLWAAAAIAAPLVICVLWLEVWHRFLAKDGSWINEGDAGLNFLKSIIPKKSSTEEGVKQAQEGLTQKMNETENLMRIEESKETPVPAISQESPPADPPEDAKAEGPKVQETNPTPVADPPTESQPAASDEAAKTQQREPMLFTPAGLYLTAFLLAALVATFLTFKVKEFRKPLTPTGVVRIEPGVVESTPITPTEIVETTPITPTEIVETPPVTSTEQTTVTAIPEEVQNNLKELGNKVEDQGKNMKNLDEKAQEHDTRIKSLEERPLPPGWYLTAGANRRKAGDATIESTTLKQKWNGSLGESSSVDVESGVEILPKLVPKLFLNLGYAQDKFNRDINFIVDLAGGIAFRDESKADIETTSLGLLYQIHMMKNPNLNLGLGIGLTRNRVTAEGAVTCLDSRFPTYGIPQSEDESETLAGKYWKIGFDWEVSKNFVLALGFRQDILPDSLKFEKTSAASAWEFDLEGSSFQVSIGCKF